MSQVVSQSSAGVSLSSYNQSGVQSVNQSDSSLFLIPDDNSANTPHTTFRLSMGRQCLCVRVRVRVCACAHACMCVCILVCLAAAGVAGGCVQHSELSGSCSGVTPWRYSNTSLTSLQKEACATVALCAATVVCCDKCHKLCVI